MNNNLQNTDKAITPTAEQMAAFQALDIKGELEKVTDYKITNSEIYIYKAGVIIAIHKTGLVTKHINQKDTK